MPWKKLLALVTGSIDEELLLRNEYLVTEIRILRSKLNGRPQLKDEERLQLAIIGKQLGRKALVAVATIVNVLKRNGLPAAPERQKETTWTSSLPPISSRQKCGPASGSSLTSRYKESPHRRNHSDGIDKPEHHGCRRRFPGGNLIHDRDSKFCEHFDGLLRSVNIEPVKRHRALRTLIHTLSVSSFRLNRNLSTT